MTINIISIGKLAEEWRPLVEKYKRKVGFYSITNIIELKENKDKKKEIRIKKETQAILNAIPKGSDVILLSLKGKQYTSEEFTKFFERANITFVIGGSDGVDESLFSKKISFSKMTFPHQMFRVILLEQIFRAFSIKNNSKYHK